MLVSQILRSKGDTVFTVTPDETIAAVAALLHSRRVGALIVLEAERVAGIVSERFGARYALGLGAAATLVAAAYGISRVGADVTASATVSPRPAG